MEALSISQKRKIMKLPGFHEAFMRRMLILKEMKSQGLNADEISEITKIPVNDIIKYIF